MSEREGNISDTTSFIDGRGEGCSQATADLISNTAVGEG